MNINFLKKKNILRSKVIQKIAFLFILIFIESLSFVHGETFECFIQKVGSMGSDIELLKQKKQECRIYKSSNNKFHLYNSKYVDYLIEFRKGNLNKAITYLNFIIINSKLKNTEQLTWVNYYMAYTLTRINAIKVSQEYAFQALRLAKKGRHTAIIATIYSEIGLNYFKLKKYTLGAENFKKAYQISKINSKQNFFSLATINDIGVCYRKMGNNQEALKYYYKAYAILNRIPVKTFEDIRLIILLEGNIGGILSELKEYDKATKLLTSEISFYYRHTELLDVGAARTLIDLIEIYEIKKDLKNEKQRISELIELEQLRKEDEISLLVHQFLYEYYLRKGDRANALQITNRLLDNTEKSKERAINELSLLSDLVYKQKITQLKENTQTNSLLLMHAIKEKKFSQLVIIIIVLFFVVVIVFAFLFYRNLRKSMVKNDIIAQQSHQIIESINYSKKIQDALLPDITEMEKVLENIIVFYEPKDIVSGDFYWCKNFETHTVIACVDCTGHGVPGGFMSTIGSLAMDKIITEETLSPSEILSELNKEVIRILRQQNRGDIQEGMDLSICIVDHIKKQISYSGARNGIIIVKDGRAHRYKADLIPVGGNYFKKGISIERQFTTQIIDISENDWIYMHTDGFIEQIGGENNLPMNYTQYEKLLISLSEIKSKEEKKMFLATELKGWRNNNKRTDDVLIIGFQLI